MDALEKCSDKFVLGVLGIIGLGQTARTLTRGHDGAVTDISVDPQGDYLCSCDNKGQVKVWVLLVGKIVLDASLVDGSCDASCVLTSEPIYDVAVPGASVLVFGAGRDNSIEVENQGIVRCWEVTGTNYRKVAKDRSAAEGMHRLVVDFRDRCGAITNMALLPGARLAVTCVDGLVWIMDLKETVKGSDAKDVVLHSRHYSGVTALLIVENRFPGTNKIVVGSETGRISVWSDDKDKLVPDKSAAADHGDSVGRGSGDVKVGDTKLARSRRRKLARRSTGEKPVAINVPMCEYWAHGKRALQGGGISAFAHLRVNTANSSESLLFSASGDTTVKMWWLGKSELITTFRGHSAAVTKLVILEEAQPFLFSASNDSTVMSWSIDAKVPSNCQRVRTFRGHDSVINDLVLIRIPEQYSEMSLRKTWHKILATESKRQDEPLIHKGMETRSIMVTCSRDGTTKYWDLRRQHHEEEGEFRTHKTFHRDSASMTRIVVHNRTDEDGLEDSNVIAAGHGGNIWYFDMFPTPQNFLHYRSAKSYELISPLIDWSTYTYQKVCFVLPTVLLCYHLNHLQDQSGGKLQTSVHNEEKAFQKIVNGKGVAGQLEKWFGFDPLSAFGIESLIYVSIAWLLVIVMWTRIYNRGVKKVSRLMKEEEYIEEIATFAQAKARMLQPGHKKVYRVEQMMGAVYIFLWATAKVMTVPIVTNVSSLIDCPLLEDKQRHLSIAHEVICWEGRHLYATTTIITILIAYVVTVVPFTLVGSNVEVWAQSETWGELHRNAKVNAGKVNLAFLTPDDFGWCYNQLTEFCVKATLPAAAILQNNNHLKRCSMITAICLMETLVAWFVPSYRYESANLVYISYKFATLYISACTVYGGYHADRLEAAPAIVRIVIAGLVVIFLVTVLRLFLIGRKDGSVAEKHVADKKRRLAGAITSTRSVTSDDKENDGHEIGNKV